MTLAYDTDGVKLYNGDCLEIMKQIEDNSIDTIVTDPPYHLKSIQERFGRTSLGDITQTSQGARDRSTEYARLSKGFMGKVWDGGAIAFNSAVWEEALRIAKPGAFLFAMGGTRTYHRLAVAIEDAGWEIRDCITHFYDISFAQQAFLESLNEEQLAAYLGIHYPGYMMHWVYGSGFPKSHDVSKSLDRAAGAGKNLHEGYDRPWRHDDEAAEMMTKITAPATELAQHFSGWGSALKPAFEPICVAMKPLDGTFAQNAEKWHLAGLNIDGGRIGTADNLNGGATVGGFGFSEGWDRPWEHNEDIKDAKIQEAKERVEKAQNLGRWPANVTHDSSEEVLGEFAKAGDRRSGYRTTFSTQGNSKFHSNKGMGERGYKDKAGSAARFFFSAKASPSEKGEGNTHPTVKPLSLMRYLCRLSKTPYGGVVLDPFAGSGTTLLAARAENREAIGIELGEDYCQIAINRLEGEIDVSPESNEEPPENQSPKQMKLF